MGYNYEDMTMEELQMQLKFCNENGMDAGPVLARINQLKFEEEQAIQHEVRVKDSVEHLVNTLDSVEIEGLPLRGLFAGEAQYQLVSIWFKQQIAEQAAGFSKQIQVEQSGNKQIKDELKEQENIVKALKDELHQATLERDQAIQYRDNAYAQLEEARKEVERLNSQVDDLRVEAAVGARNAFKVVTNLDGAKELADQIRASLTPVTNIETINGTTIRVTHADGSTSEDSWLSKGKYRLIDEEEAARFRESIASNQASVEESVPSNPALVEIEEPTFPLPHDAEGMEGIQSEADSVDHGTVGANDDEAGPQSLEERVSALEREVSKLTFRMDGSVTWRGGAA